MNRGTVGLRLGLVAAFLLGATIAYGIVATDGGSARFRAGRNRTVGEAMWRDYYDKRYGALFYHLYARGRLVTGAEGSLWPGAVRRGRSPAIT